MTNEKIIDKIEKLELKDEDVLIIIKGVSNLDAAKLSKFLESFTGRKIPVISLPETASIVKLTSKDLRAIGIISEKEEVKHEP